MSQTIPGQRLHAVMEHGWHVSGSNGSQSRMDRQGRWMGEFTYNHTHNHSHSRWKRKKWKHGRAAAYLRRVRTGSSVSQASLQHWSCMLDGTQRTEHGDKDLIRCLMNTTGIKHVTSMVFSNERKNVVVAISKCITTNVNTLKQP